jgi:glycosyltransferase involved in cell wall biosynthesis
VYLSLGDGVFADELEACGERVRRLSVGGVGKIEGSVVSRLGALRRMERLSRRWAPAVAAALREEGSDFVQVRWPNLVSLAGRAGRSAGVPTLWLMCNAVGDSLPLGVQRRYYGRVCRREGVLAVGNSRYTAATVGRVPRTHMYLGVDTGAFDPRRSFGLTRASVGLPDGGVVVGVFGRLSWEKGQDRAIAALSRLGSAGSGVTLLFVGGGRDGGAEERLRREAARLGVGGRVVFAGEVDDPAAYYALADVTMNCRIDAEPFGFSVVESLLMERPVIAHALGGPAETVRDGVDGWHTGSASADALAAGIGRALVDRPRWGEMGEAGRRRALSVFSLEAFGRRFESIARRLVERGVGSFGRS